MRKLILLAIFSTVAMGVTVKQNISLTSFNAGELSPLMQSRVDFAKYKTGAKTLENMLVRAQGPVQRRPGTKYIATVKDSNDPTRLFSFEYSTSDTYIIEAGDQYFRFYRNGAQIYDGNDPYEIVSPYDSNDIFEVQCTQDAQYMRFVHPDYQPYKLTRSGHTAWSMTEIPFTGGPFLDENENTGVTITVSGTGSGEDYDYYITGDDTGIDAAGSTWISQSFTSTADYNAVGVNLNLFRIGQPGTVTVSLRTSDANKPTGADLASGTISGNSLTTNVGGEWRYIVFSSSYTIEDANTYAIVVRATTGDSSNKVYWRTDATSPTYTTGSIGDSSDNGSSWTAYSIGDSMFKVAAEDGNSAALTLDATADIFDDDHVGSIWQITHTVESESVSGQFYGGIAGQDSNSNTITIQEGRRYHFTTHGGWRGTVTLQRSYDNGSNWEDVDPTPIYYEPFEGNVQITGEEETEEALYRVHFLYPSAPYGSCNYNLIAANFLNRGIVEISSVTDANTAVGVPDADYPILDTTSTYRWAEGAWSDYRGWPRTVTHHEQRCIYGGSTSYPQAIWASITVSQDSDYDNFDEGQGNDDDAWTYVLPGMNPIQWLVSGEYLMVGTTGGIGRLGMQDKPISPTFPPTYRMQARNGSAYIQAVPAVDAILYVERGSQKVREITYTYSSDRFIAPDMTILAEHITGDGIVEIAFQDRPDPILWSIREDGQLLSFTYNRKHEVLAWSEHDTGASGEFESVARIPGTTEDQIWFAVKRTIDSNDWRYIEQLQPFDWGTDQNDCWFVDCGGTDINDISQLEGETVALFNDARPAGTTYTVSSGAITITDPNLTNFVVGLPYTSVLETMPLVAYTNYGDSMNKNTTVKSLTMDFYETLGAHVGTSASYAADILFSDDSFDTTIDVFSGVKPIPFARGQIRNPTIYIYESDPVPLTIRNITADVDIVYE